MDVARPAAAVRSRRIRRAALGGVGLILLDGNVSQAAQTLGLSRSALYRRLRRHGL